MLLFCYLILALAATVVWTLLDSRRANYARLHEWLRVYSAPTAYGLRVRENLLSVRLSVTKAALPAPK